MNYSTTKTYTLKREIVSFTNKISKNLSKPYRKFTADITYGMLAANSCLLTDVADQLHEKTKKVNIVERLSDIIKPNGYKFEALDIVRDGSKSSDKKSAFEKGYHVTEACVITNSNHPVSIYSKIHSSREKNFISTNNFTFEAMERGKCMAFLAHISMKPETSVLKFSIIQKANSIKKKSTFSITD